VGAVAAHRACFSRSDWGCHEGSWKPRAEDGDPSLGSEEGGGGGGGGGVRNHYRATVTPIRLIAPMMMAGDEAEDVDFARPLILLRLREGSRLQLQRLPLKA
jgi:hypothetical protein